MMDLINLDSVVTDNHIHDHYSKYYVWISQFYKNNTKML